MLLGKISTESSYLTHFRYRFKECSIHDLLSYQSGISFRLEEFTLITEVIRAQFLHLMTWLLRLDDAGMVRWSLLWSMSRPKLICLSFIDRKIHRVWKHWLTRSICDSCLILIVKVSTYLRVWFLSFGIKSRKLLLSSLFSCGQKHI